MSRRVTRKQRAVRSRQRGRSVGRSHCRRVSRRCLRKVGAKKVGARRMKASVRRRVVGRRCVGVSARRKRRGGMLISNFCTPKNEDIDSLFLTALMILYRLPKHINRTDDNIVANADIEYSSQENYNKIVCISTTDRTTLFIVSPFGNQYVFVRNYEKFIGITVPKLFSAIQEKNFEFNTIVFYGHSTGALVSRCMLYYAVRNKMKYDFLKNTVMHIYCTGIHKDEQNTEKEQIILDKFEMTESPQDNCTKICILSELCDEFATNYSSSSVTPPLHNDTVAQERLKFNSTIDTNRKMDYIHKMQSLGWLCMICNPILYEIATGATQEGDDGQRSKKNSNISIDRNGLLFSLRTNNIHRFDYYLPILRANFTAHEVSEQDTEPPQPNTNNLSLDNWTTLKTTIVLVSENKEYQVKLEHRGNRFYMTYLSGDNNGKQFEIIKCEPQLNKQLNKQLILQIVERNKTGEIVQIDTIRIASNDAFKKLEHSLNAHKQL